MWMDFLKTNTGKRAFLALCNLLNIIYIRATSIFVNNLCIWQLIEHYRYKTHTHADIASYTIWAFIYAAGLWLSTTKIGLTFKKSTLLLLLGSAVITFLLLPLETYRVVIVVSLAYLLAFINILRGNNNVVAKGTVGGGMS